MKKYIKREDAYTTLTDYYHHSTETQHMALKEALDRVPAADVIERKDAIPIEWMVEKLTGHPELSYTFTDGVISVIDVWNKENGNQT